MKSLASDYNALNASHYSRYSILVIRSLLRYLLAIFAHLVTRGARRMRNNDEYIFYL